MIDIKFLFYFIFDHSTTVNSKFAPALAFCKCIFCMKDRYYFSFPKHRVFRSILASNLGSVQYTASKMSSEAEVIICYCLKCGFEVGSFDNSWEGLGKTYYIPKVIHDATGLKGIGSIKLAVGPAQVGTIIENRYVLWKLRFQYNHAHSY